MTAMIRLGWWMSFLLGFTTPAFAAPITVILTIPGAHGTLSQPSAPGIPFSAASITFVVSGDTGAIYQPSPGVFAFSGPIVVLMPGYPDATISNSAAAVSVIPASGSLSVRWPSYVDRTQGAEVQDAALVGYALQTSIGVTQAPGGTFNGAPTGGAVLLPFPSGQGAAVAAGAGRTALVSLTVVVGLPAAIEFYNASLDHYFLSTNPQEVHDLDLGVHPGWRRTGESFFTVGSTSGSSANPVCRFYIPPQHGDSHFFSADPVECAIAHDKITTDPNFSGYVEETPNAFYIALPDKSTGACPAGTAPVFRLWNQRTDSNHRYTTSIVIRDEMLAKGYVAEGYGPSPVDMCAPQ